MEFKRCRDLADAWLGLGTVSCQGVGKNMGGVSALKMLGNIWKYMEIYGNIWNLGTKKIGCLKIFLEIYGNIRELVMKWW
jgi:hypothetical protein